MKKKNLLALILVFVMLMTLFAACGNKENGNSDVSNNPSGNAATPKSTGDDDGELEEINLWVSKAVGASDDEKKIYAAINEITERELGIRVNFTSVQSADYLTQLTLAIANNEPLDIIRTSYNFTQLYSSGCFMDITDLLNEYGQDIKDLIGEDLLATTTVNGKVYCVPAYNASIADGYLIYKKDVLESVGMLEKFDSMTTWVEFEEILEVVKDQSEIYGMGGQAGKFINIIASGTDLSDSYIYDYIGDNTFVMWTDQEGNIDLLYSQESVVDFFKMTADWYKKGYYYSDSISDTTYNYTSMAQNKYAGYLDASSYGVRQTASQSVGAEMVVNKITNGNITTSTGRNRGWAIASTSTNQETAMRLLNYMYTSEEIMNFLCWGIEGENYVVNDEGEAAYLEGKDSSSSGYHNSDLNVFNQFLVLPWEGQGGNYRAEALEAYNNAARSIYCGASVDTTDYSTLISAISSVRGEYFNQMYYGQYTDALYQEFLDKLASAGVDEYIDLYRDAVSEFFS